MEISAHLRYRVSEQPQKLKRGHRNSRQMFMVFFTFNENFRLDMMTFSYDRGEQRSVHVSHCVLIVPNLLIEFYLSDILSIHATFNKIQIHKNISSSILIYLKLLQNTSAGQYNTFFGSAWMTDCTRDQYSDLAKAYHIISSFKALKVS